MLGGVKTADATQPLAKIERKKRKPNRDGPAPTVGKSFAPCAALFPSPRGGGLAAAVPPPLVSSSCGAARSFAATATRGRPSRCLPRSGTQAAVPGALPNSRQPDRRSCVRFVQRGCSSLLRFMEVVSGGQCRDATAAWNYSICLRGSTLVRLAATSSTALFNHKLTICGNVRMHEQAYFTTTITSTRDHPQRHR